VQDVDDRARRSPGAAEAYSQFLTPVVPSP
jgi:hypothetical protein